MDTLLRAMTRWRSFTAVVVGDFMLDHLVSGVADRLSADAPVPVLHVSDERFTPGGAANVCLDLVAMRGEVRAVGLIGHDGAGERLRERLASHRGIDTAGLVVDPDRPTTVKQNLIGLAQSRHPQKMFRVDYESTAPAAEGVIDELVGAVERALDGADVLCLEDYNKGVCTPALCARVIELARKRGVPVLVDPAKIKDYARYAGATAITPNRTEAEHATGIATASTDAADAAAAHNAALARALLAHGFEAVVLTLDRHGALLLCDRDEIPVAIPTVARSVYDVTGAGDMMLAGLAAARANGLEWPDAVRLANAAAGLEVEVFGVQPIPFERIAGEVLAEHTRASGKRRSLPQAVLECAAHREAGRRVVFTNGCFDVLHAGHVHLLAQSRALGDVLVVGLNSDESIRGLKGPSRPVHVEDDRVKVLSALESVDSVVVFGDKTPIELIRAIRPDVLVKGADYVGREVVGRDVVEGYGGRVELVDLIAGRSSSAAIERLGASDE